MGDSDALVFEEDTIEDHQHIDPGHAHTDGGHTHPYIDRYPCIENDPNNYCDQHGEWGTEASKDTNGDRFNNPNSATTSSGASNIQASFSNIGGVADNYRKGTETKPKNMNVVWIMRVW